MSAPPGHAPTQARRGASNRELRRIIADRINAAGRRAGVNLLGWQVRSVAATLIAAREEPTDEQIVAELMRAPWYPKQRVRRWRVGETGWRTTS